MIKINLCPIDELESQYWYVPDIAVAAVVAVVSFLGVQYYLGTIQERIDTAQANIASLTENTDKLKPDLERFVRLKADGKDLNTKLDALKAITVSKISKYKPVIVIEHFQNLRPEGVWFEELKIGVEDPETFEVKGQAFDNILTAEFLTAIRSTENGEADDSDLRTQVYFKDLELVSTSVLQESEPFPELQPYPVFKLKGKYAERTAGKDPVPGPAKDPAKTLSHADNDHEGEVKF